MSNNLDARKKWWALVVLCLGTLMIVLDTTIVNVALPSIKKDLGFTDVSLAWVVNAYMLTFGGFLLLSGRLGDLFGHRKLFVIGLIFFTLASLACGLSPSQGLLISARAIQGWAGAIVSAVSLSLMMSLFTEAQERAKAMGIFGFVAAGGGSIGVLLGGVLTGALNWHWIFLVNIPVGILVIFLSILFLPKTHKEPLHKNLDIAGAVTITTALMLAVYAIVNGNVFGWTSTRTVGLLGASLVLHAIFLFIESSVSKPMVPLRILRLRNVAASNIIGILWSAAMFASFFLSALYMQTVLGFSPLKVGLAFLPSNLIMAIFSVGLSAKLVMRLGIKLTLSVGLGLAAISLLLLARVPVEGHFVFDILPSMILLGIGGGMAFNPMLLAAMNDVSQEDSGLASGLVNTSFMMGGALGLAILASIASSRTASMLLTGAGQLNALTSGYHAAFLGGAISAGLGSLIAAYFLKIRHEKNHEKVITAH